MGEVVFFVSTYKAEMVKEVGLASNIDSILTLYSILTEV